MSLLAALNLKPPPGYGPASVLAGNAARLQASAKPPSGTNNPLRRANASATASASSRDPVEVYNRYAALYNGIKNLADKWEHPSASLDITPSEPKYLVADHRRLLLGLQRAIAQIAPAPQEALDTWERVAPGLRREVAAGVKFGIDAKASGDTRDLLDYLEKQVFVPGAYQAAKREAVVNSKLTSPDLVLMAPRLAKAEHELGEAQSLWDEALKIGSSAGAEAHTIVKPEGAIGDAPKTVKEIIEIVQLPGTIQEKLEAASKRGIATTAADLVAKVSAATGSTLKLVSETGEKFIKARIKVLVERSGPKAAEKAIEQLEKAAGRFKKLGAAAKAIGTAASFAAVIADGVRLVVALRDGDYGEVADAAVDMLEDAAPLAFGDEIAGPLAIAIIAVKADIEAIHLAAAAIRQFRDERVRQAAGDFVAECDRIGQGGAKQLVADCLLLINATNPKVQQVALGQANREAATVSKAIRSLSSQVTSKSLDLIGGYPPVVKALGSAAITAMTVTFDEKDGALLVAQQIDDVFKGANAMAAYVQEHYKH
ncbi:MAG: hypothetical protein ACXWJI_01215 [Caldimonas sp.]